MKADVVLIVALQDELKAILTHGKVKYGLTWASQESHRSIRSYHVALNNAGLRIAAVQASGMGSINAAILTSDVIADCVPKAIILVGIAASCKPGVNLGDVVISEQLIDYELGKKTDKGISRDYPVFQSSKALRERLVAFDAEWSNGIQAEPPSGNKGHQPKVHSGDIFCGSKVVADAITIPALLDDFRKGIALEMESVGIASYLEQKRVVPAQFVMVKGITDKADAEKNDAWRAYAAEAAAAFTLAFLNTCELFRAQPNYEPIPPAEIELKVSDIVHLIAPDLNPIQALEHDLTKKVVTTTLQEVGHVLSGQYKADFGHGHQFLIRAIPLFEKASRIYATSLDTVSTFWTNKDNRAEAREYVRHQAPGGEAMRLFVFSDADSTHKHARILDHHAQEYRNVFVCSMPQYRKLLDEIADNIEADKLALNQA